METENTKRLISAFITTIWNNRKFSELDSFLADDYLDHSLPGSLPRSRAGTLAWIKGMDDSFEHRTEIVRLVCEASHCIVKINLHLKHIGKWRGIEATGSILTIAGYRSFEVLEGKITAHWALIDGDGLEKKLLHLSKGCIVQQ